MGIGIAIGLASLAGIVLLARYVAAGGMRLGVPLALLVLAVVVTFSLTQIAGVYYRIPVLVMLVLVALLAVVGWLFIEVGRGVAWHRTRLAALVGMLVAATALATLLAIAIPTGQMMVPLFETRAAQIAGASGFTALLAPDQEMPTDQGNPVAVIDAAKRGVSITYKTFTLGEWKADGALTRDEMRAALAPGKDALQPGGLVVASGALYEELTVSGAPALGVEFQDAGVGAKGTPGGAKPLIRVLVFERDGVQVRLLSDSKMVFDGISGGQEIYSWQPALDFAGLATIGESLQPAE